MSAIKRKAEEIPQTKALLAQSHPWDVVQGNARAANVLPLREGNLPFCKSFGEKLCFTRQGGGCYMTGTPETQTRHLLTVEV